MKLVLKNFRCHLDETFDFGEEGLTLISGQSGNGKSTIMNAIYFALFGKGNKIISYGQKSCKVILEIENLKIVRTKRPNRLLVNEIYENDAGQSIINEKFGDTFNTTGYISQNAINSFILMSPLEKLSFLEKFAFNDIDLVKIKKKCKELIIEKEKKLNHAKSKLEMALNVLEETKKPEDIKFPVACKKTQIEKTIKNYNIKYKNSNILIKRYNKKISKLQSEINSINILNVKLELNEDTINSINSKIDELDKEKSDINYIGDRQLSILKQRLNNSLQIKSYTLLCKQLEKDTNKLSEIKNIEVNDFEEEIMNINSELWNEYTKEEIIENIDYYNTCLQECKRLNQLKNSINLEEEENNIDKLNNNILLDKKELESKKELYNTLKLQNEIYLCPCCNSNLRLKNGILLPTDTIKIKEEIDVNQIKQDINILTNNIKSNEKLVNKQEINKNKINDIREEIQNISSKYENELDDIQEIKDTIEYLNEYYSNQKQLLKRKKKIQHKLNNNIFSPSYNSLSDNINILKERIEKFDIDEELEINIDEEEIRREICIENNKKERLKSIIHRLEVLNSDKKEILMKISDIKNNHYNIYNHIRNINNLEEEIKTHKESIKNQEKIKKETFHILELIEKWEQNNIIRDNYNKWEIKVKRIKEEEKEEYLNYSAAMILKEKIIKAESISVLNIIESINSHAQIYLESFFPDNPISVRLVPFKLVNKKIKSQINIEIEYKGMEAEISMLSGGELARVILAFTLALAEMFNTNMILLDECTASLDEELSNTVFEGIRDNFNGKLVLIIAHQVVTGAFDKKILL